MYKIFVIEDDRKMASIICQYFKKYGYEAQYAIDFDMIKQDFLDYRPDLVLLDINLPAFDGFYWCRQLRRLSNLPIIFLSARASEMDQVYAIENGGDDYITKPFHLEVLLAKVKGVLRRSYGDYAIPLNQNILEVDGLFFYRDRNTIELNGQKVECSPKEFRLLICLAEHVENIVSRDKLLEAIWDEIDFVDDNTLNVNIRRGRRRLEDIGITDAIQTVRGQGYCLKKSWGPV
ncbi:response regulator transcription factor [Halalkalibacterium halodurans]|jgi:DNA-binding response OmpR family regulator|uniref:Two-component response regulator n=2 Tax=Halalkalibacterium halodurans TaxID=86665 RepID=Q9KEU4_HALH5|nr:response regulator transcription factor [Halalkalibacterium halodurans]MED3647425.1 response regulator transcription factor [Halalkalibacterium halodurans]MED4080381.1 response regulator transcription factor [Halalkalibacterium halodurans]MED4084555.1 response regulator transcription factor [Halalkalibacterium halodurans]MED4104881.1 response regulator transcription factor [Halalkalibacterium halodurans]MED4109678.1 response regulator transcription factor [Halalkalibacterium halodurans]